MQTPTPAPAPTQPPSTCSTPTLQSPGNGSSFDQSVAITLYWYSDCAQIYAELTGGPYGTMNFGGWQSVSSMYIGPMWPGSYTWQVLGRSSDGIETIWSSSWSFVITSSTQPTPTNTPAAQPTPTDTPVVPPTPTDTPVPQPTPTSTACPYQNNYGQFPTFYAQPNYQGQSVTFSLSPGQDLFFTFPNWLQQNLQSFTDPYGAFHIVTFHTPDHGGNLAHWDASQPSMHSGDGYQGSASVEIYYHRTC
jgi:hypothetical protein